MFDEFHAKAYRFTPETGALCLSYGFRTGPSFEETILFPPEGRRELGESEFQALDRAFRLIFLLAGVSYYKAYAPATVRCLPFPLDVEAAQFLEKVYQKGLAEFAFRNNLNLNGRIRFIAEAIDAEPPVPFESPRRLLVPVGGGKDSIVTIETLKKAGEPILLFAMGSADGLAEPIRDTIQASGLPHIFVQRTLSPELASLNAAGALNGHVPITAILSAVAVAAAILYGCDGVALSNESSAEAPNTVAHGAEVNHQYSKSLAFEEDLAAYLASHVTPSVAYFSFLRPLGEAEIARRFAEMTAYHGVFRSCNAAFKQQATHRAKTWCGDCPKCRFVFLALAPFMPKARLVEIFGADLLSDPRQVEGYRELCGLSAFKPFECVGTVEESALLLRVLTEQEEWKEAAVLKALRTSLRSEKMAAAKSLGKLLKKRGPHRMPPRYREMLDEA